MIPDDLRELLLTTKALPALVADTDAVLERIMRLAISDWNEQDVRAEVIDPLIRVLGYDKESHFSLVREKPIEVLGAHKALDYSMSAFRQDFWLIEAKRPGPAPAFHRDDLYQALRYAAHPEINAALLVLCDGNKIEVFDREQTLSAPVLRIARADLAARFDELRKLLGPWQAYFFERRRVLRLIDKVFDNETHVSRLEEFVDLVTHRLQAKRETVLQNWRDRTDTSADLNAYNAHLETADAAEIIGSHLRFGHTGAGLSAIERNLVQAASAGVAPLFYRLFPVLPQAGNGHYWSNALAILLAWHAAGYVLPPLPMGTSEPVTPNDTVIALIDLCLNSFADDPPRRVILLQSLAARRLIRLKSISDRRSQERGELRHLAERAAGEELSFAQSVSSAERHLILQLDSAEFHENHAFVIANRNDRSGFRQASAEQGLREIWAEESALLSSFSDYPALLSDRGGGETHPTEADGVIYDNLGHSALCVLDRCEVWKAWTLKHRYAAIIRLAELGSWQARKWLDMGVDSVVTPPSERIVGDRFFLGDTQIAGRLKNGYFPLGPEEGGLTEPTAAQRD